MVIAESESGRSPAVVGGDCAVREPLSAAASILPSADSIQEVILSLSGGQVGRVGALEAAETCVWALMSLWVGMETALTAGHRID